MPKIEGRHANGPLTPEQRVILNLVAQGYSHMVIAGRLNRSRVHISESMRRVTAKLQVANSQQAAAIWGRMLGLEEAAALADTEDRHGLAGALRERAEGLVP